MNINEIKRMVKLTEVQEKAIISHLGDDLEVVDSIYESQINSLVDSISSGNAPGLITIKNPLLGIFMIVTSGENADKVYIASARSSYNLKCLLTHNMSVYDTTKKEVLETLGISESDYQLKLIEKIKSDADKLTNNLDK